MSVLTNHRHGVHIVVLGGDRVGKLLRNFGQVDRKETSLETPRFIVSSCRWQSKFKQ